MVQGRDTSGWKAHDGFRLGDRLEAMSKSKLTPAMQQFMRIKQKHPDTILLFRMGDFYETFFDDAKTASRVLDRKSTRLNSSHIPLSRMPSSA